MAGCVATAPQDTVTEQDEPSEVGVAQQADSNQSPYAYRLGIKSSLDTNLDFTEFFGSAFTIGAWVMPEYMYGWYGPIFSVNGSGTFSVGYGDFRQGDFVSGTGGSPVLTMRVGGLLKNYLAPGYTKRQWHYIAVERTATDAFGSYIFRLFLDGSELSPIVGNGDGTVSPDFLPMFNGALPDAPTGKLRVGQLTSDGSDISESWQWYGLIDDLTVFNKALTTSELQSAQAGVSSATPNLYAGWTFDQYSLLSWSVLDSRFKRPITSNGANWVSVTSPRSVYDYGIFDDPAMITAGLGGHYRLPFAPGEVWTIIQEPDTPTGSHNGYAEFCYDIGKPPPGSANATVYVNGNFPVAEVLNQPWVSGREGSHVRLAAGLGQFVFYLHLNEDSFDSTFLPNHPGAVLPTFSDPSTWIPAKYGEPLATDGVHANHLHTGLDNNAPGQRFATLPGAYYDYQVSDDQGATWRWVRVGRPKAGQWVKVDLRGVPGDVDGDGKADILATGVAGWTGTPIAFSTGTGAMRVTNLANPGGASQNFNNDSSQAGAKTLTGDFDADGRTDILSTGVSWWNTTPVAFSNGDGTFHVTNLANPGGASQNFNNDSSQAGAKTLAGDFDGDGRTDILSTGVSWWNTTPVAFSNGDGTFHVTNLSSSVNMNANTSQSGAVALAGDFDGDGKTDFLATGVSSWSTTPVAFSNGDGTFRVTNLSSPVNMNANTSQSGAFVLAGDFDGDGKTDFLATGVSWWNTVPVAFSNGDGTFRVTNLASPIATTIGGLTFYRLTVGDYNGDGKDDIAVISTASGANQITIGISNGNGTFQSFANATTGDNFSAYAASTLNVRSSWR